MLFKTIPIVFAFYVLSYLCTGCRLVNSRPDKLAEGKQTDGYTLVWADEFNREGPPDTLNWRYEIGFVRNQENQWYQQENIWCHNGLLIIEGRKEIKPNPGYVANSNDWKKNIHQAA